MGCGIRQSFGGFHRGGGVAGINLGFETKFSFSGDGGGGFLKCPGLEGGRKKGGGGGGLGVGGWVGGGGVGGVAGAGERRIFTRLGPMPKGGGGVARGPDREFGPGQRRSGAGGMRIVDVTGGA